MGLFSKSNKDVEIDFSAKGMTAISKGSTVWEISLMNVIFI